jgi:hypothetical protein
MASIEDPSRFNYVEDEREQGESVVHHSKCDGTLLFLDEELEDSPTSLIDLFSPIDPTDYFESSEDRELSRNEYTMSIQTADVPNNSEDIPALVDVSDSSDNEDAEVSDVDIKKDDEHNLYGDLCTRA